MESVMLYSEKIAPPGPPPVAIEPPDVLSLHRTIASLEEENTWLKAELARALRSK
jgi:hypothetical protein